MVHLSFTPRLKMSAQCATVVTGGGSGTKTCFLSLPKRKAYWTRVALYVASTIFFRFHQYLSHFISIYPLGYNTILINSWLSVYKCSDYCFMKVNFHHQIFSSHISQCYHATIPYQFMIEYHFIDHYQIAFYFMNVNLHHLSRAKTLVVPLYELLEGR